MSVGIIFKLDRFVPFGFVFFFLKSQSLRFRPAVWNGPSSRALSPATAVNRLRSIAAGVSPTIGSHLSQAACGSRCPWTCVNNCLFHHLQLCRAACRARPSTEVCSPLITPSAHGWPTSATAAIGSPPKSWRPQSASQTAPGATTTRYPDAAVRNWWGEGGRMAEKEGGEWSRKTF